MFNGELDLTNSMNVFREHYNVGDIVTIQDNLLNKYINPRILSAIEVQDENGYKIDVEYGA